LFIATGQDAGNVAESSAALDFSELLRNPRLLRLDHAAVADRRDLQRRDGPGQAARVPGAAWLLRGGQGAQAGEIVAATVLCDEFSLGWAILAQEWVRAHDRFYRNRP
jgi:hydroxymethylglutaryl-CoA reductase (NADPH)